jgi:hypothetical protein
MKMYWSPAEPGTLRFPKPQGVESFEVDSDSFVPSAAVVFTAADGSRSAAHDPVKLQQLQDADAGEKAKKNQRAQKLASLAADIDNVKQIADVKAILKTIAGLD